jgi:RNA 2',3'-cyclic 3'-phosphodiesterase
MARLRTFIAIDLGKNVRDRLASLQDTLSRHASDVKWVEGQNLHLTLLFLGEVDFREVPKVCQVVEETGHNHARFGVSVVGVGAFPNLHRPRTLWVGVQDGAAQVTALHDDLEGPLLELGCYRREDRPFTPHITIGRWKGGFHADKLATALAKRVDWHAGETVVDEVLVMSSELTPQGPVYTVLGRGKLRSE